MARLLVTGGAGFVGSNFVLYWLKSQPLDRVVVLDALTYAGNIANLEAAEGANRLRFVRGAIGNTALVEKLLREEQLDVIVHFAAESHVDRSIEGPDAFVETNIVGTHSMLKAARRVWLEEKSTPTHRFHHVSTDEVYGSLGPKDPAFTEESGYAPNSPYSATKAGSDHLVRAYYNTYGLQITVSNSSNNYGPRQFPEKLIPVMIARLLGGQSLPIYGDGRNIRDWIYVEDHCRGIEAVLRSGTVGEVYNIGGGSECENNELVRMLCKVVDEQLNSAPDIRERFPNSAAAKGQRSEGLISYVRDRPGHDRRYSLNCAKVARECAFRPSMDFEAGLRGTVMWYLERPELLQLSWHRKD